LEVTFNVAIAPHRTIKKYYKTPCLGVKNTANVVNNRENSPAVVLVTHPAMPADRSSTFTPQSGDIVFCRQRQWVVIPSESPQTICLRPLSGNESEIFGIYEPLLDLDPIEPASFPLPDLNALGQQNYQSAQLLVDAVRMSLRSGGGAFRCLGRLSVRARPYQIVPLLMALRQETMRLLIADDVGVGKTIEAGLILREMLDRREIDRIAILCPPQLCDQWQRELAEKFHIDAVVVRSGTISKLERQIPPGDRHLFEYYRHVIVSLDYVKSDRRRASFLAYCPDCVVVDEAHTCANRSDKMQQRYQLLSQIAQKSNRHLILLTATPHSGIERSFMSLIGLLKPEFEQFELDNLSEAQRQQLAAHFIQRRRADVREWLGDTTPFPERIAEEADYTLSRDYRELFEQVYEFARGLVKTGDNLSHAQRRGRYWSALAIIRCVMSSPDAAVATLQRQASQKDAPETESSLTEDPLFDEDLAAAYVDDPTEQERTSDLAPSMVVERGKQAYSDRERRLLREFVKAAQGLQEKGDRKLQRTIALVGELLEEGSNPILWCRYIATAKYVAAALQQTFGSKRNSNIRAIAIHGEQSEEERETRLAELAGYPQRILVATDCLSEGINLQEHFSSVIHYDLPWNPNRLEQREGRVDRYGQKAERVRCILLFGKDNPVDGAVLEVLIRKAVEIHRTLGITVPVPMDSETVSEAVFKSLFERATDARQLSLFELGDGSSLDAVHQTWDRAVEREKRTRTRFAQRSIKPEEVERELVEVDRALGKEADVERFVRIGFEKLQAALIKRKGGWEMPRVPDCLQPAIGVHPKRITFYHPAAEGMEYIGRNHPLVEALAHYVFAQAFDRNSQAIASRCNVIVTDAVAQPTVLMLLRLRHRLETRQDNPLMVEECLTVGFTGTPSNPQWLEMEQVQRLWETAQPTRDLPLIRQQASMENLLKRLDELNPFLAELAQARSQQLGEAHRRVRAITKEGKVQVKPILPMDIIGLYLLFGNSP
jgi:superfamily II DNA or RNA helicase